jgi:RHS repeat-associated protein
VDGGQTATYVYNALNQRVRATVGGAATEYVFNASGQRVSEWNGTTRAQLKGKYYWGGKPVAYYANGSTHFEHQDWLGTERLRTTYNGGVEGSYISLPFGDGFSTLSGTDADATHYATLDHDAETATDHAEFRQYSEAQGRWLSPDPYDGSYDASNPQSFNRYTYTMSNPLAMVDPSGLTPTNTKYYSETKVCVDGFCGMMVQETNTGAGGGGSGGMSFLSMLVNSIGDTTTGTYGGSYTWDGSAWINNYNGEEISDAAALEQGLVPRISIDSFVTGPVLIAQNASPAPNNGRSYTRADVCAASALLNKGGPAALDALGAIPGEGNLLKAGQAVGGFVTAGIAIFGSGGNSWDGVLTGTGLGVWAVDTGKVIQASKSAAKAVPMVGNVLSGISAWRDIWGSEGLVNYYNDCMAGKN